MGVLRSLWVQGAWDKDPSARSDAYFCAAARTSPLVVPVKAARKPGEKKWIARASTTPQIAPQLSAFASSCRQGQASGPSGYRSRAGARAGDYQRAALGVLVSLRIRYHVCRGDAQEHEHVRRRVDGYGSWCHGREKVWIPERPNDRGVNQRQNRPSDSHPHRWNCEGNERG